MSAGGPEASAAAGKAARARVPLESHREFDPAPSRDPVGLLLEQAESRIPELVPVRHGRMLVSPFTFYRGAALPMAADLATAPSPGFRVQLCGDAHLSNFGAFGSPERRLVFDVNDFDETLPGPFEWDIKRLVASLVVAGAPDYATLRALVSTYAQTLPPDRRHLLGRFRLTRVARKVVGVGSVGTQAWIVLMEAEDGLEPLLLQAKQAQRSVLAAYAGESQYDNQGERVVWGQRMMQAASDIFLGWQRITGPDGQTDYYLRQLRDWKYSAPVDQMDPATMAGYGELCGWTLARAHARTGDRFAIAAYLGGSARFEEAIADFGASYAAQTVLDHAALADAVASGRAQATPGV